MNTKRASERVKEVAYITEMIFQFCFYLYFAVLGYDFSCIKYFIFTILVYNTNPHNDHPQVDLFSSSSKRATPATWVRMQYNAIQFHLFGNHCNAMQYNTTLSGNAGPVQAWHFQAFSYITAKPMIFY